MIEKPKAHKCFAIGCNAQVPNSRAYCASDWERLPLEYQTEIYHSYENNRPGSLAHLKVLVRASRYLLSLEVPKP